MKKEDKNKEIEALGEKFSQYNFFYITDASTMTVEQVNKFRRICFDKGVEFKVAKNKLIIKALAAKGISGHEELLGALKGPTAIMFSEGSNTPAKVIKEYRKAGQRPVLKAAYIASDVYIGDDQLDALIALKSKNELIADVIAMLQSPVKNVISGLQASAGNKIAGLVKTLSERENN